VRLWRGQVQGLSHAEVAGSGRNYGGMKADGKGKVGVSTASSGLMRLFRRCSPASLAPYRHFIVADRHVGWVDPDFARVLAEFPTVFYLTDRAVQLHDRLDEVDARSAAVADVLARLHERGHVPGWRGELYPVNRRFGEAPLLLMERAATPLFGLQTYGINVNGLVRDDDGWKVWIARRAMTKHVDPGMLDLIVGGGVPHGISLADNLLKECAEEAGIGPTLAEKARPVSLTTMVIEAAEGLRIGVQFNYDLELPADFQPRNDDGEVSEFRLWSLPQLEENLRRADDFMFDAALAKLDLLVRLGIVGPEEPDYLDLVAQLRRPAPFVRT
jgi:8-oxo-dGTP pyrophosphatase MutT (NUDIX family)